MKVLLLNTCYREVPGFTGAYVSLDGVVVADRTGHKPVHTWPNESGYLTCKVGGKSLTVHRAVALAWLHRGGAGGDVNHIDGNKLNNCAKNLEWCTRSENIRHALDTGLHAAPETPVIGVNEKTGDGVWAKSQASLWALGFQQPNVNKCLRGERRTHRGFKWRYVA